MLNLRKAVTSLLLGILLLGITHGAWANDICFPESEAGQIVVSLEKCQKISIDLSLTEQQNANLLKQLELKDSIITLQEQKIVAMEELMKVRQQIADEQLSAEKKSKWRVGIESFGAGGIFGAIGVALCVLLL